MALGAEEVVLRYGIAGVSRRGDMQGLCHVVQGV